MKNYLRWGVISCAVLASAYGTSALAQTVTIGSGSGQRGDTVAISVSFQQGAGNAAGYQTRFTYDTSAFGLPTIQAGATATCTVNDATGEISVIRFTFPATVLTDETACTVNFPIDAAAPFAVYPLAHVDGETQYSDTVGTQFPATAVDGQITVADVAVPLTLAYAPAAGSTITFAGGSLGASAPDQTIDVTAAGNSGTATLSGCAISGTGQAAFSVAPTSLAFNAAGTQSLTVGCDYQAAASTATLTCSETDADSTATSRSWSLSCPAGSVTPVAPTVSGSTPAVGSDITIGAGSVGATASGSLVFNTTGGAGTGTTTVACTSNDAAVTVTPASRVIGVGATTAERTFTVNVVLTDTPQTFANAVTCTVDGAPFGSYGVAAPGGTTFAVPEIIPSASTWSKIAMFGLLGLFGMMAVGFRRHG